MLGWGADPVARCGTPHGCTSQPDGLESTLLPAGSLEQQERRQRRREQARAMSRRPSVGGGKEGMNLQGVSLQAEVPLWAQVCHSGHSRCTHAGVTSTGPIMPGPPGTQPEDCHG